MMFDDEDLRRALGGLASDYEIIGELGRGGTSVVFLARERELGREVAIKVIRQHYLSDAEATARFEREARTLARLQHPNIIPLYGAKRLPDRGLALVMQLMHGCTLREAIRRGGRLPFVRAERVLRDIAEALAYLHRHDILHRDIKPENIFLEEGTGRAVLSDFGIAKAFSGVGSVTLTGVVVGTPAYMSPEQIDGADLDGRSDLYSLGLVGYEMLTGHQPWQGESLYNVIWRQKGEQLPPLETIRPDVPEHLRVVIGRALEKNRLRRWPNADELLRQLEAEFAPLRSQMRSIGDDAGWYGAPQGHSRLGARDEMVTVEFRPSALPARPATTVTVKKGRNRKHLVAATLVLCAGGVATIPLLDRGVPPIHAEHIADTGDAPRDAPEAQASPAQVAAPARSTTAPAVPRSEDRSPRTLPSPAPTSTQSERAPSARPLPSRTVEATITVPPRLAGHPDDVRTRAIQGIRTSISQPPAARGPVVAAPEIAPVLRNEATVQQLIVSSYPADLREQRIGGTITVLLLIDEAGSVVESTITGTSGDRALDAAAVRVARGMKFTPAEHQGRRVRTRLSLPLVFEPPLHDD